MKPIQSSLVTAAAFAESHRQTTGFLPCLDHPGWKFDDTFGGLAPWDLSEPEEWLHDRAELGDTRWKMAGDNFGEAVAGELKERVFAPLNGLFKMKRLVSPDSHYWPLALKRKAALGQMIRCLDEVIQKVPHPHPTLVEVKKWMGTNSPAFLEYLESHSSDLRRLATLRGEAQHSTVTESEARTLFKIAACALDTLTATLEEPPSPEGL